MAILLLAACTQDEPGGQGNELPYGEYPLQIGGVTIDVESSAESWSAEGPQTRVTENNTDGKSSVWEWNGSEMIGVRLGNETATYTLNADKNLRTDRQLYWTSTAPTTVTAWYPTDETVNLSDQSNALAYVLKAEAPNATYNNEITLSFKHQLAKVRVVLSGTQATLAQGVGVYGYTTCTNNEGVPTAGSTQGWLKMKNTTYADGTECWEANVVPGTIDLANFIRLNGHAVVEKDNLTDVPEVLNAAKMYTINLTVGEEITEITEENNSPINDDGYYRVSGTFNHQISITGGSPTIYLENANISAPTPIRITGNSTATIHVTGGNSAVTSTSGTGMLVEKGSTLIIISESTDNVITVRGKNNDSSNDYPGIGGNESGDCGTIRIENVTVHAYGDGTFACAPGIGPSQNYSCEGIIINEAVVYAYGTGSDNLAAPGIGSGMHNFSAEIGAIPKIEITHSTIHAVRGGVVADYIGRAGWTSDSASSEINPGTGGSIKSSTVYCHTRDTDRLDKTMVYDASGNATQQ